MTHHHKLFSPPNHPTTHPPNHPPTQSEKVLCILYLKWGTLQSKRTQSFRHASNHFGENFQHRSSLQKREIKVLHNENEQQVQRVKSYNLILPIAMILKKNYFISVQNRTSLQHYLVTLHSLMMNA